MAREFSIIVSINADGARRGGRQFKQGADQVRRSSEQMRRGMNRTRRSATALITTIGRMRGVATLAFAGFLGVGGLGSIIRTLSQFSTALSKIEALLGDRAVGGAMAALTEKARELGATTVFTATQAAEGMQFLTLAGFDALEVFQAIGPALTLAQAGTLGLGEAADIVSNIMAGFGVEAANTTEVVDVLAFTASRTNTDIRQLGQAMKFVAPVAGAMGVSVEETAVALGILGNAGLQASLAGTSLRRVFSGLLNPSREATKVLTKMKLSASDLVDTIGREGGGGLVDAIDILAKKGLGAVEAFVLFGQRGAPGMLTLIRQLPKLKEMNNALDDIRGTALEMARVMTDNIGGDARIAISSLQESILKLGDAGLTQFLRETTQGFTGFIRGLSETTLGMENASAAMLKGAERGAFLLKHITLLKNAIIILIAVALRGLIFSLATTAVSIFTLGKVFIGMGFSMATLTAGVISLKAAFVTLGPVALALAVGGLAAYVFGLEDADQAQINAEATMDRLELSVKKLAFAFVTLTQRQQELAQAETELFLSKQSDVINKAKVDLDAFTNANEDLIAAKIRLTEVTATATVASNNAANASESQFAGLTQFVSGNKEVSEAYREVIRLVALSTSAQGPLVAALAEANKKYETAANFLAFMDLKLAGVINTWEEFVLLLSGPVKNAQDAFTQDIADQTGATFDQVVAIGELVKKYGKNEKKIEDLLKIQDNLNISRETELALIDQGLLKTGQLIEFQKALNLELLIASRRLSSVAKAGKAWQERLEDLQDGTSKLAKLKRDLARETDDVIEAWIRGGRKAGELSEALTLLNIEFQKNQEELKNTCKETKDLEKCMSDAAKAMETLWDQALRNIQDAFADAFKGAFDSFESFADKLLGAFKELFANIAAEALILNLFGGGSGFFSDLATGITRGFGSSGSGGVSSGGGVGSGVGGGILSNVFGSGTVLGDAFASFTAGTAAFFTNAANFLTGGATSGFFSGGAVTSNVSVFNTASQNASIANPSGAGTFGGAFAGAGIGLITGSITDAILGGRGDPTRNAIFSAIGGAIGSIWGPIGSIVGGAIGSFVDNLFGGAKKLESAILEIDVVAGQWFGTQTDIISKQRSFFRGKKYTTTIKNVNSTLQALEDVFLDFAQILEVGAAALGGNAEGFLEGFSASLTLDLKRMDSSQVQNALTDFLNDTILRAISEFLKDVEGLEPHVHAVLRSFSTDIESFVLALDFLTGLQNLFDIDLLDEATKAIEESQMGIIESYQNALAGYREIIAGYDGSIESLELLTNATAVMIQVQLDLIVVYQQVGLAISSMFQDSAQTIRETLMSEEELHNFRQQRIDELIEQASMTTDPEELQSIANEIDRLGLATFNALDAEQQQLLGPEFIQFFDDMDEFFAGRIDEGIDSVIADQAALDEEVSLRLLEAAEALLETARIQQEREDRERERQRDEREFGDNEMRA